ncbi:hypothetical protein BDK51DRAFT_26906 [Blyttiomyces helicus]|uniref:Uncharacterized protein n=1 Tax=Blyttiomyces helicus TaxID=388810 RepID=A0A4P9W3D6_9FUNG|nr:hypothetical protein BDK51DRAFT_26906 [Blyttiomyces helicus]|eukprot:RKO86829.1 hypothetical protein BDK51DRAFT_26906 [Blyttiomyces helicus]
MGAVSGDIQDHGVKGETGVRDEPVRPHPAAACLTSAEVTAAVTAAVAAAIAPLEEAILSLTSEVARTLEFIMLSQNATLQRRHPTTPPLYEPIQHRIPTATSYVHALQPWYSGDPEGLLQKAVKDFDAHERQVQPAVYMQRKADAEAWEKAGEDEGRFLQM